MDMHVNYLAVAVAAVVNYIFAFIWYGLIFGKLWMKFTGITDMKPNAVNVVLMLAAAWVMSLVLNDSIAFRGMAAMTGGVRTGLMAGFFGWLGFIVPVTLSTKLYEKKPWGLFVLDNGFWLLALLIMGTILALWM